MTTREARQLLDAVFEEQALVIGGLITVHVVDDAFVRRLFRSLGAIRTKALKSLGRGETRTGSDRSCGASTEPHPAIEQFLSRLGKD